MQVEMEIKSLTITDFADAVRLHQASFPRKEIERTIFGGKNIVNFLQNLTMHAGTTGGHQFIGSFQKGRLVGYSYIRLIDESCHLNYICVDQDFRKQGIGIGLMQAWRAIGERYNKSLWSLDVKADKGALIRWYEGFGLRTTHESYIYEVVQAGMKDQAVPLHFIPDWAQAEAFQEAYGFSRFTLHVKNHGRYDIRRIGDDILIAESMLREGVIHALKSLFPGARLFVQSPEALDDDRYSFAAKSVRMCTPTLELNGP